MTRKTTTSLALVLFLLALAGCATPGGGKGPAPAVVHQADERIPSVEALPKGDPRVAYYRGRAAEMQAQVAESSGNKDQARASAAEAAGYDLAFLDAHPDTGWDLPVRYHAAELLARADRFDDAAAQAERLAADARASEKTRAMAWLLAANALVDAGKLETLKVAPAEARQGRPANPRPVQGAWKQFVDATDAAITAVGPGQAEPPGRIMTLAQLAFVAAEVQLATDHVDDARARLAAILDRWPGDGAVFLSAAPLWIETFAAPRDAAGAASGVERVHAIGRDQEQRVPAGARAPYEKGIAAADRVGSRIRFQAAKALLDEGKPADAARAFEALASGPGEDPAAALNAAAIAWDRAGEPARSADDRRRILRDHGSSRAAPGAAIALASDLGRTGEHLQAAQVYEEYLRRWPDDPNRCAALRNRALELEAAGRTAEAPQAYAAFGREAACARATPDAAAIALHHAGTLFTGLRQRADAQEAFRAAAAIANVSAPEAKRSVADAKRKVGAR